MRPNDDDLVANYLRRLKTAGQALPPDRAAELVEEISAHITEARAAGAEGGSQVRNILERLGDPADIVMAAVDPVQPSGTRGDLPGTADGVPGARVPGGGGLSGGQAWHGQGPAGGTPSVGALEVAAVILLLVGGLILPFIGWVIGVILLWTSPRWKRADKWLGTLVWPGGLLAPAVVLGLGGFATLFVGSGQTCSPSPVIQSTVPRSDAMVTAASHGSRLAGPAASCSTSGGWPTWLVITLSVIVLAAAIAGPIFTAVRLLRRARQAPTSTGSEPPVLIPA